MNAPNEPARCPRCKVTLPASGQCSACEILEDGFSSLELPTELFTADGDRGLGDSTEETIFTPFEIGSYRIVEEIGEGGFGIVYRAEQRSPIRREVALKVIKPGMDSLEIIRRFEAERQALALMEHPNIAQVFDAGATESGRPYFVMELVRGQPITTYCDERKLTILQRLELFIPVCQAVQHAHQKAVLHRDLKPSNILVMEVDGKPVPKVIDFGIAKALDLAAEEAIQKGYSRTQQGSVIGTLQYMSPEQAGSVSDVDTRSDIYALGAVLYEMLTGQTPLTRERLKAVAFDEILRVIREEDAERPSLRVKSPTAEMRQTSVTRHTESGRLARTLSGDLDWIVMKALEKDRTRRYETANGFAEDIRRFLANEPVSAAAPGVFYRVRKFARRNKVAFTAGVAVFTALTVGISVSLWQAMRAIRAEREVSQERDRVALALQETDAARRLAIVEERKAKAQVLEASRSDFANAQARLAEGKWREGVAYLGRSLRYDPYSKNAREALWGALIYGRRDFGRRPYFSSPVSGTVGSIKFSPNGRFYLATGTGNYVEVRNSEDGSVIGKSIRHNERVNAAEFSPDGTRVVTASKDHTVRIWDAASGEPIGKPMQHDDNVYCAAFSNDGLSIVSGGGDNTARVWSVETCEPLGVPMRHLKPVWDAVFSPDSNFIATASDDQTACVWSAKTGGPVSAHMKHLHTVRSIAFSPDGKRVVTASWDGTARIWEAETGKSLGSALNHKNWVDMASFSPDGTRVLTCSRDGTARLWNANTYEIIGLPLTHKREVLTAQFNSSGTRIVTSSLDNTSRIWDGQTGLPVDEPLDHGDQVFCATFSPDGQYFITGSLHGVVRLWDARTRLPQGLVLGHNYNVICADFSPSDKMLVTAGGSFRRGEAQIWDRKTGQPVFSPMKHEDQINSVQFSSDGLKLVTGGNDNTLRVWDAKSGQAQGPSVRDRASITLVQFSPSNRLIISGCDDMSVSLWDAATLRMVGLRLKCDNWINSAMFSLDESQFFTGSHRGKVQEWNIQSGKPIGKPITTGGLDCRVRAFSKNGTHMITSFGDYSARIVEIKDKGQKSAPLLHKSYVDGAKFNADGTIVVTASRDNTARVWEAATGIPLGIPMNHNEGVMAAGFSPNGDSIITASKDGTARVWDWRVSEKIDGPLAEKLAIYSAGATLDPLLGNLQTLEWNARAALEKELKSALMQSPLWQFALNRANPSLPSTLVSPFSDVTIRQNSSSLIQTMNAACIREAYDIDPTNPLIPFAFAMIEAKATENQPANPVRSAWLCSFGLKHLPRDISASDLRLAARLVASIPDQEVVTLLMLNQAHAIEPANDETKALRSSVMKHVLAKTTTALKALGGASNSKISMCEDGYVDLDLSKTDITDLSKLTGLPLRNLALNQTAISDLSPLAGLPIKSLWMLECKNVTDLSPLRKCPQLRDLQLAGTGVRDLKALEGLNLTFLAFARTEVIDLSPLRGMPLERIFFDSTKVTDVSPLLDSPMIEQTVFPQSVTNVEVLRTLPALKFISVRFDFKHQRPAQTAEQFWAEVDQDKK